MFCNSVYKDLVTEFEANKDKYWKDWLKFDKILNKAGKQGVVGLFKSKEKDIQYFFKMSQNINFLIQHELLVLKGLRALVDYCPHFCKGIGSIKCEVESDKNTKTYKTSPFSINSKYSIEKEVLLCEFMENSSKFFNYIRTKDIPEKVLYSTVKQVLMAILVAQKKKNFSHYDLHSNNVMIKKCNKNVVFLYRTSPDDQFCIPTYGYYPVIIDFGFSYISDMDGEPLWTSLVHTEVGFMSDRFDWVADPKLFLVSVSDEIKAMRGTKQSVIFRRVIKNMFHSLKIDFGCGWDDVENKSAGDYILDIFAATNSQSRIFNDCPYYCLDILQSLIVLPLEEQKYDHIEDYFNAFIKEWIKIENEISNEFFNIYVLKNVISSIRDIRPLYFDPVRREEAVSTFKNSVYNAIEKVSKYCRPKKVNYEKMLCSAILLAQCMEGVLYDIINARMETKKREYQKMPLNSIEQMFAAIDINIPSEYKYTDDTIFVILDAVEEKHQIFNMPKGEAGNINSMKNIFRGPYIWDLFLKK